MGSAQDIMHEFVKKELKTVFPAGDGWVFRKTAAESGTEGFMVSRRSAGKEERANVLISFEKKLARSTVGALHQLIAQAGNVRTVLVIPQGADAGGVPAGVQIVTMRRFGFKDKDLVWLDKNMHNPKKQAAST